MFMDVKDVNTLERDSKPVLLCFGHLRWNFVFQRPQHLMSRFSKTHEVIYWEEPNYTLDGDPTLNLVECESTGVTIATPTLPEGMSDRNQEKALRGLLDSLGLST